MYQLMQYVSNGTLDTTTHEFNVPTPKQDITKRRRRRLAGEKEEVSIGHGHVYLVLITIYCNEQSDVAMLVLLDSEDYYLWNFLIFNIILESDCFSICITSAAGDI